MTDCTHHSERRARKTSARRAPLLAALFALALAWQPAAARADGDPASDVLATQALFLPQDAGATPIQRAQLSALLQATARRGYPIAVALASLGAPGPGAGLAGAAITGVRRLAAAAGHPLPLPSAQAPRAGASSGAIRWLVLAAGALAIAIAWGLSLRARPLRLRRRSAQTTS